MFNIYKLDWSNWSALSTRLNEIFLNTSPSGSFSVNYKQVKKMITLGSLAPKASLFPNETQRVLLFTAGFALGVML